MTMLFLSIEVIKGVGRGHGGERMKWAVIEEEAGVSTPPSLPSYLPLTTSLSEQVPRL